MFKLFRDPPDRQMINEGRVACPRRSTGVELDVCFRCPSLLELEVRRGRPFVHCTGKKAQARGKGWIF